MYLVTASYPSVEYCEVKEAVIKKAAGRSYDRGTSEPGILLRTWVVGDFESAVLMRKRLLAAGVKSWFREE